MPDEGENLVEHITRKYQTSPEQYRQDRAHLQSIGLSLGITFHLNDGSRIYNTFRAHQLLHWAQSQNRQHQLQLALFEHYFTHNTNISDPEALTHITSTIGLDKDRAKHILDTDSQIIHHKEHSAAKPQPNSYLNKR